MLFEGLISYSTQYANGIPEKSYDKLIKFENGYFGVKDFDRSVLYLAVVSSDLIEETKSVSNLTSDLVSLRLDSPDIQGLNLGIGAQFDETKKTLTLFRDFFGQVPLYYVHIPGQLTVFSTDLVSIVRNPLLKGHISVNAKRVANYATFLEDSGSIYTNETFYTNVFTALPGHLTTIGLKSVTCAPYARLDPSHWSHLTTLAEFGEEFRTKFQHAVERSTADQSKILASHLSGGMDSSSISAMVKHLYPARPLETLYNKSNTIDSGENFYALAVAKKIGSNHHEILQSEDDFNLLSTYISLSGQPSSTFLSPSSTGSLMQYAKSLGCNAILNGSDGDAIVGSGLELINEMFDKGDWEQVKNLLQKRVAYYSYASQFPKWDKYPFGEKYHIVLQNFLFRRLSAKMMQLPAKDFLNLFKVVSKNFNISYRYFLQRGSKTLLSRAKKGQVIPSASILRDHLLGVKTKDLHSSIYNLVQSDSKEHQQSIRDVFNAQAMLFSEQNFVISNYYEIQNCSPFYDRDIFELCMAVPTMIKYGDGIGRAHFREGMKGLLPEEVRLRSTKTHIRSHGQRVIRRLYNQAEPLLINTARVWEYVDTQKFNEQVQILKNDKVPFILKSSTWFHISRTISLAIWLEWLADQKA